MANTDPNADVMITPGCFETRTVRAIKRQVQYENEDDEVEDATGYIALDSKRTPVRTGYWGDVAIWQLDRESQDWPRCPKCDAHMDIGQALYWRCAACGHSRYSAIRQKASES